MICVRCTDVAASSHVAGLSESRAGVVAVARRAAGDGPAGDDVSSGSPTRARRPPRRWASAARPSSGASARSSRRSSCRGAPRLIPVDELERYLAERRRAPRDCGAEPKRPGRPSRVPARGGRAHPRRACRGQSLSGIARLLTEERVPTARGGRRWWPSTVRASRSANRRSPRTRDRRTSHPRRGGMPSSPAGLVQVPGVSRGGRRSCGSCRRGSRRPPG